KVFGDGGTADVEASGDLVDGLAAITQAVQNGAACGVGDGVEDSAVLRNHFVTCFVRPGFLQICNRMVTSLRPKDTLRQEANVPRCKLSSWVNEIISDRLIAGWRSHGAAGPLDGESGQRVV